MEDYHFIATNASKLINLHVGISGRQLPNYLDNDINTHKLLGYSQEENKFTPINNSGIENYHTILVYDGLSTNDNELALLSNFVTDEGRVSCCHLLWHQATNNEIKNLFVKQYEGAHTDDPDDRYFPIFNTIHSEHSNGNTNVIDSKIAEIFNCW